VSILSKVRFRLIELEDSLGSLDHAKDGLRDNQKMLRLAVVSAIVCGLGSLQAADLAGKRWIDCDANELLHTVPDLAGTKFDTSQASLDSLLQTTGEELKGMLAKFVDISATEQIHEMRLEADMEESSRRETFRYVIEPGPDSAPERFAEQRLDPATMAPAQPPNGDFLVLGHFYKLLAYLLPQYRKEVSYRYVGSYNGAGTDLVVVAFAQNRDSNQLRSHIGVGEGRAALLQGIVWIDAATHRIVRLRADVMGQVEGSPLQSVSTDIALVPVNFAELGEGYWLPAAVTVHARYAGGDLHSVHRYSDYRLYGIDDDTDPEQKEKHTGVSQAAAVAEDAWELLDRGESLTRESKPADAVTTLREALRLNPELPTARYRVAAALRAANDAAGAEAELRETLKMTPNSGPSHNFLGILLFQRGEVPGAVAELRTAVQLQPADATVHFNLAQALEKTGERKAALEEYRSACTLAPDNAGFKSRYEQLEHAANTPPPAVIPSEATIKVEVRQVLVPVVVTDKQGHHATGLKQADFQVFEDGVEQKISGFSVENAGVASPAPVAPVVSESPAAAPAAAAVAAPPPIRRTYLICIDALHTEFANLVHIRESLVKLFRTEQAGDARYVVISVGANTLVVQDATSDPTTVLKAIDSKDFQKLFLSSRRSSAEADLQFFRRALDQARASCDAGQPECEPMKRNVRSQAMQMAEQDRFYTATFLGQFRSLIDHLRRDPGRRTMILFSDGFQLVPGRLAFELLAAYFPDLPGISLRTVDRMTDLEPLLRLAANSNIPIYTIDARGLYTDSYFDASNGGGTARLGPAVMGAMNHEATEAGATLSEIAAATGGTAFQNSNNIFGGLQRAFADGREYYMLAYVSSNPTADGKFRGISVKVRDSKLVVSAKRGYWATGPSN
jgi:VWFA-related protein